VPLTLETSLQFVKGIGPRIAQSLQDKRIATIEDLLYHLPFRYEDRLRPQAIEELVPGEMASLIGEVRAMNLMRTASKPDNGWPCTGRWRLRAAAIVSK